MLDLYYENISSNISYRHSKGVVPLIDFHLHESCEIYFLISGSVNYFIEKKVYPIKYGDLIITNNHEIHKPSYQSGNDYERIFVQFNPAVIRLLNSPSFDLLGCFFDRSRGDHNKISLGKYQLEELLRIFNRLESIYNSPVSGSDILKLTCLIELLVFINRAFKDTKLSEDLPNVPEKLIPILDFIDTNLESNLSLETLENKFYINRFYLSRLFKKSTGSNIHQYILYKRISKAKKLLSDGYSVTEACMHSGFSDYSNFIRMFKKTSGVSPGQYNRRYTMPAQRKQNI